MGMPLREVESQTHYTGNDSINGVCENEKLAIFKFESLRLETFHFSWVVPIKVERFSM